jgi:hypothetical protein
VSAGGETVFSQVGRVFDGQNRWAEVTGPRVNGQQDFVVALMGKQRGSRLREAS